ncbi:hypothetical protein [Gryllotalpicola kribbensis]|uniref:hypothetical protein n=1 Tax=Gryllotalpicola kribbensis TaxID=993084 RepID=UPI0031D7551F
METFEYLADAVSYVEHANWEDNLRVWGERVQRGIYGGHPPRPAPLDRNALL